MLETGGHRRGIRKSKDAYAQDLRCLYQKAYLESLCGSGDAEKIGKTLLASQFVAGLRSEIKKSVTGSDLSGDIKHFLVKARFEEAKLAQLKIADDTPPSSINGTTRSNKDRYPQPHSQNRAKSPISSHSRQGRQFSSPIRYNRPRDTQRGSLTCHNCGGMGHFARECRWKNKRGGGEESKVKPQDESRAKPPQNRMSAISSSTSEQNEAGDFSSDTTKDKIASLRKQLQEAEMEEALTLARGSIHGISPTDESRQSHLGTVVNTQVELEGVTTDALLVPSKHCFPGISD